MMKYFYLMILALLLSCTKKDTSTCAVCTTTWIISADSQVSGYPKMTTTSVELCDMTEQQLSDFEDATQGSESNTVDNVLYTSSHSTRCTSKQ
jgi:hypothetical protein